MEVAVVGRGIFDGEQAVVFAYLGFYTVVGIDPMQGSFHLAVGSCHAAFALGVVLGFNLNDISILILLAADTLDDISVLQAHFFSGSHAEELLGSVFHEVGSFNPEITRERDDVCSGCLILGIVDGLELLGLFFGIVGNDELHGVEYG